MKLVIQTGACLGEKGGAIKNYKDHRDKRGLLSKQECGSSLKKFKFHETGWPLNQFYI